MTPRDPSSDDTQEREETPEESREEPEREPEEEVGEPPAEDEEKATDPEDSADDPEASPEGPDEPDEEDEPDSEDAAQRDVPADELKSEPVAQQVEPVAPDPAAEAPAQGRLRWLAPLLVTVVGLIVLLPGLSSFGLWEPPGSWQVTIQRKTTDEAQRSTRSRFDRPRSELLLAEEARRAAQGKKDAAKKEDKKRASKDPLVPRRPPLTRWLISLGFRVFGVSEGAGRLPLALTGVLCLVFLFFLLRRLFGTWTGLLGAAVLLGLPAFLLHARQLTSDIVTWLVGLLAVGGLGLACAPIAARRRFWWLIPGVAGLVLGGLARGAVVGVLLPAVSVLLAVAVSHRLYLSTGPTADRDQAPPPRKEDDALRTPFLAQTVVLLVLCGVLIVGTASLLSSLNPPRYSGFLGETPINAVKVMSPHGVKTPTHQLAVFDVMLKQLGYAAFPWIALLPLGLAFLLYPAGRKPAPVPPLADEPSRLARYGRWLLVSWLTMALLVGTYWVLRFGDLQFPALPAVAGVLAVLLLGLARERPGRRRILGLAVAVVVLAIVFRDLLAFPEMLVSSHINYQLQYPAEVSYKRFFYVFVLAPFALLSLALLVSRGRESPVRWPSTVHEWYASSQLGIGRWFGLRLEDPPAGSAPVTTAGLLSGGLTVALLMAAGGGAAWALMKRPVPGLVVLSMLVAPILLPLVPYLLATALDLALFPFEVVWQVMSGRLWKGDLFFWSRDELLGVRELVQRAFGIHPLLVALLVPSGLVVAFVYLVRLVLRALILFGVLLLLAPVVIYGFVRSRRSDDRLPTLDVAVVGGLALVPLIMSAYIGWSLVPRLSEHYSYKAIIETYNHSHNPKRPEPLALFKVKSRSPVFYTKGPLVRAGELQRKYPRAGGSSTLLQYLENGWTDKKGLHHDRVYAIVPVGDLGQLDRDAHARDPAVPYYVLDARNSFYVLLSNRLGKKRVNGRRVAEKDLNPLRRMVMNERPKLKCDADTQCVPIRVTIAERKGETEPALELIGAKFPKVVSPGRKFNITLHFKVLKRIRGKYKVFVHIDGRGNRILGDHDPVGGKYHTSLWLPGRYVVDSYTVPASASSTVSTPSGWYIVMVGLFQGDRRMQVLSGPQDGQNRIRLGRLRVGRKIGCGCGGR